MTASADAVRAPSPAPPPSRTMAAASVFALVVIAVFMSSGVVSSSWQRLAHDASRGPQMQACAVCTGSGAAAPTALPDFFNGFLSHFRRFPGDPALIKPEPYVCPFRADKWAVLTTIQGPTSAVRTLARQPGWSLVVVGDTKTPKDYLAQLGADNRGNVIFLPIDVQRRLPYKLAALTPERSYTRKNLGYLVAIQCGARVMYETDDDNELLDPKGIGIPVLASPADTTVVPLLANRSASAPIINVYAYFGRRDMWPRGIPLEMLAATTDEPYDAQVPSRPVLPIVQQFLADLDPDVDALLRLTKPETIGKVVFDVAASPVALARGTFSPYNTQNTITLYEGFWGLLLPSTVTFRVTDILRGYWVQRLLWDIGGSLVFGRATVIQERNPHSYIDDFRSEAQLFSDAGAMVTFLASWSSAEPTLFGRIRALAAALLDKRFWAVGDVDAVHAWLDDLDVAGYKPPTVLANPAAAAASAPADGAAAVALPPVVVCITGAASSVAAVASSIAVLKASSPPATVFALLSTRGAAEEDLDAARALRTARTLLYRPRRPDPLLGAAMRSGVTSVGTADEAAAAAAATAGDASAAAPMGAIQMLLERARAADRCAEWVDQWALQQRVAVASVVALRAEFALKSALPNSAAAPAAGAGVAVLAASGGAEKFDDVVAVGALPAMRAYLTRLSALAALFAAPNGSVSLTSAGLLKSALDRSGTKLSVDAHAAGISVERRVPSATTMRRFRGWDEGRRRQLRRRA